MEEPPIEHQDAIPEEYQPERAPPLATSDDTAAPDTDAAKVLRRP